MRLGDIQQLQHHGRHAAKMAGAELAIQDVRLIRRRLDMIGLRLRIHLGLGRREQMVNACGFKLRAIRRKGARIFFKILTGAELQAIHENRGDHHIGMTPRLAHQGNMPGMQVAHRGHDGHALCLSHGCTCRAQAGNRFMDMHQ